MRTYILLGISFALTLLLNPGWIAMDEYNHGMLLYLPAQTVDIAHVIELSYLRSPMQVMPMYALGKIAHSIFGIESNWGQYRFIQFSLGFINLLLLIYGMRLFFAYEKNKRLLHVSLLLVAFHFVSSFVFTRPMFESIASPLFLIALGFFQRFYSTEKFKDVLLFFVFIGLACLFRPHVSLFTIIPFLWAFEKKEWGKVPLFFVMGLIALLILGLPDLFFYGRPFNMFQEYMAHNLQENKFFSSESKYGASAWWVYFPTFVGIALLPFFIKLKGFDYRSALWKYRYYWIATLFFIVVHSTIPHKEERFLIPLLPVVFVSIAPFVEFLYSKRKSFKIRYRAFVGLNLFVWVLVIANPAQNNAISFAKYLKDKTEITRVQYPKEAKLMIYSLFFEREDVETQKTPFRKLKSLSAEECSGHYLFRYDYYEKVKNNPTYTFVEKFNPGFIEHLIVMANPKHNARRGPLFLMECAATKE